jgi:hypothetical protein
MDVRACPLLSKIRLDLGRLSEFRMEGMLNDAGLSRYYDLCRIERRLMAIPDDVVLACPFSDGELCARHGPQCEAT